MQPIWQQIVTVRKLWMPIMLHWDQNNHMVKTISYLSWWVSNFQGYYLLKRVESIYLKFNPKIAYNVVADKMY